jgi:membrane protein implicated in regulation of membrane protease activity
VQLAGELWSARALTDTAFDTGTEVLVTQIDGATAVVTSSGTPSVFKES